VKIFCYVPSLVLPSSNSIAATISSSFIAYRNQNSNLYNDDYCKVSELNENHPAACSKLVVIIRITQQRNYKAGNDAQIICG
jgi:hypothetical protein